MRVVETGCWCWCRAPVLVRVQGAGAGAGAYVRGCIFGSFSQIAKLWAACARFRESRKVASAAPGAVSWRWAGCWCWRWAP